MLESTQHNKPAIVLLVEDDLADQELTKRALVDDFLRVDLRIVNSGNEAMDYLLNRGKYADVRDAPRPDLVLLDLNLPGMNGREVLEAIRSDASLRKLVVVVLTTSGQDEDVIRSYELNCHSYITKPVQVDRFVSTLRSLGRYWLQLVTLPSPEHN